MAKKPTTTTVPKIVAPERVKLQKGAVNVINIPIDKVKVKKGFNPRTEVPKEDDLKKQIKKHGLIHPITVCPLKPGSDTYYVVAGHRRLAVYAELGQKVIPAQIKEIDIESSEALTLSLIENDKGGRHDLSGLEQAKAFQRLMEKLPEKERTNMGIARAVGCDEITVRRTLKLLDVPDSVATLLKGGRLGKLAAGTVADAPPEIREKVAKRVKANMSEGEVRKIVNEERNEAAEAGDIVTARPAQERNRPVGNVKGQLAAWRGAVPVRAKMTEVLDQIAEAAEFSAERELHTMCLTTLMWVAGTVNAIDTELPEVAAIINEHVAKHADDAEEAADAEEADEIEETPKKKKTTTKVKAKAKPAPKAKVAAKKAKPAPKAEEPEDILADEDTDEDEEEAPKSKRKGTASLSRMQQLAAEDEADDGADEDTGKDEDEGDEDTGPDDDAEDEAPAKTARVDVGTGDGDDEDEG